MAETADKATQDNKPPEVPQQGPSSRVPAIMVSLAALAIVGGATANALPNFNLSALPGFNALPKFSQLSLPNFNGVAFAEFRFAEFLLAGFQSLQGSEGTAAT